MAQSIPCDGCQEEMATVVLNMIETADVKGFGPSCFADFAQAFLGAVRPEALAQEKPKATRKTRGTPARPVAHDGADDKTPAADATV